MTYRKYIRDGKSRAVILADAQAISEFSEKRTVNEQLESMKREINMLKNQVEHLTQLMNQTSASK